MFIYMNKAMLPANTTHRDDVTTEERVTRPIGLVLKKPPRLIDPRPTSPSGRAEEPKEMSAGDFPKLRGFA